MHVQDAGQFLADAHAALEKVQDAEQLLAIAHAARGRRILSQLKGLPAAMKPASQDSPRRSG